LGVILRSFWVGVAMLRTYVGRRKLHPKIKCLRFLLRQRLALHGNGESESSINKEKFLELLHCVQIFLIRNAQRNNIMKSQGIQIDPINSCARSY
jgi:hypothetical protein